MALHTRTGVGSPVGAVTPDYLGQHYVDTGSNTIYQAYSTANTDWSANLTAANIRRIVDDKSGAYTIVAGDLGKVINVNATAGAVTLTLTAAATMADGFWCYVRKADSSGNAVTIDPNAAETINGSSNTSISSQFEMRLLVCDGTTWFIETDASSGGSSVSFAGLIDNAEISITRSGNAETFHLKTASGADPSGSDIVKVGFANATGGFDIVQCTSALSFTFSSGSTGGAVNALEFKVGIVLLNNAGTLAMGAVVRPSGIKDNSIVSTTAEGGAGAADSPRVIYSASALTNVRARVLGYATYTLAAVGTWNTAPSDVLLTRAGAMEVQVKELLYEKTLGASGNFDTNEWWPSGTLPSGYDKLEFSCALRGADNGGQFINCYINGDTTVANYRRQMLQGSGTAASASHDDNAYIATAVGADGLADGFSRVFVQCAYPSAATHKELLASQSRRDAAATTFSIQQSLFWENTAAINRLQISAATASTNFVANSRVQIHGFKSVSVLI